MRTHGQTGTLEYKIWSSIKDRCLNPKQIAYARYGGRGITVCDRWRDDFAAFTADMGPRPSRDHTVDRIDNDGPYEPGNCRWATRTEQSRNQRRTVLVMHNGEQRSLASVCEDLGMDRVKVWHRIFLRGWSVEDALSDVNGSTKLTEQQARHIRQRCDSGERLQSIADEYCVNYQTVWKISKRLIWRHLEKAS